MSGTDSRRSACSDGATTVFIDPFDDLSAFAERGMRWDYPPITGVSADLLLVTHEHRDHNGVGAVGGDPAVVRSTAGTHESPIGEVVGIASEHDDVAGTQRGHNTLYVFSLGGMRVAHLGDLGQAALRQEQLDALGRIDLLLVPVGGGPTIGAEQARAIVDQVARRASSCPTTTGRSASTSSSPLDAFGSRFTRVHEAYDAGRGTRRPAGRRRAAAGRPGRAVGRRRPTTPSCTRERRRAARCPTMRASVIGFCATFRMPSWSMTTARVSWPAIVAAVTPPAPSVRTVTSTVLT